MGPNKLLAVRISFCYGEGKATRRQTRRVKFVLGRFCGFIYELNQLACINRLPIQIFYFLKRGFKRKELASYKYRGFNASRKKRHGHTQERGPKGKRKQIEGKKSQDSLRHGSLAQWHASCKLIGESWAQEDVMVASVMARNGTGSINQHAVHTHTHTLGSSFLFRFRCN